MFQEYIELDYAGWGGWQRLTHIPSGDTCLRNPYLNRKDWLEKKAAFLSKYPNLIISYEDSEIHREKVLEI